MQATLTAKPENNELADQIVQERSALNDLRILLKIMDFDHKIAVAQIACNQIGAKRTRQIIDFHPCGEDFDAAIKTAATLMRLLPPDTLAEIAIEILSTN